MRVSPINWIVLLFNCYITVNRTKLAVGMSQTLISSEEQGGRQGEHMGLMPTAK